MNVYDVRFEKERTEEELVVSVVSDNILTAVTMAMAENKRRNRNGFTATGVLISKKGVIS